MYQQHLSSSENMAERFNMEGGLFSKGAIASSEGYVLLDLSLTVKAATLIFISGCVSAISSAKEGKSGFIYNLVKC